MNNNAYVKRVNFKKKQTNNDVDYLVCLLLGCIDSLSRELAVRDQIVPEYIASRYLLEQALNVRYQTTAKIHEVLENDYGWLIDHLENLIY